MNGQEQFKRIYEGRAHRCMITDLNPRTTYRMRVMPKYKDNDNQTMKAGDWSQVASVSTKDWQRFETSGLGQCATH